MSASECLEHSWLAEKEMPNKTSTIKIENLRIFLARRKLKNVGRVLRVINVFKETARDSRFIYYLYFSISRLLLCQDLGMTVLRRVSWKVEMVQTII